MKRKVVVPIAAVLLAAGVMAGCGSDSGSSGGSGSTADSSTKLKSTASGAPIKVGTLCSCSGAQTAVLAKAGEGVEAWAASVNAKGGIDGHPVKVVVKDDGGDPTKAIAAAKELVQQDKVIAVVGATSLASAVWSKVVDAAGIPVVGGFPSEPAFSTDPNFYPIGSSLPVGVFGQLSVAKAAGKKKFGVLYCAEATSCAQLDPVTKGLAGIVGISAYVSKVSGTAPNYTAPCLALKSAGVDAIYVASNATVVDRVINGCAQQGYKPLSVTGATSIGDTSLKNPNFDGTLVVSSNAFYNDTSIPAVKDFQDAVFAFDPEIKGTALFNPNVLSGWIGGKLFEAAAANVKLTPTSKPSDVAKGLYALKDETLGGLAPPLNFAKGKPAFPGCYFVASVVDKAFKAKSSTPTCLEPKQLRALGAALAG